MKAFISIISVSKKTILLLCSVVAITLVLFCSSAFAAPLQQTTLNTKANVSIDSNFVQTKTSLLVHSSALLNDVHNGTITKSHMFNLVSHQVNAGNQTNQTTILSANNQPIALNTASDTETIGYMLNYYKGFCYTYFYYDVDEFVNDINNVSFADVYFCQDIAFSKSIEIKDNATITIHLCGHVLSGKDIKGSWNHDNEPIIKVEKDVNLTVIGSENDEQASLSHTLNGFNEMGEKQSYDDICGGVITADQDDDIIGIEVSGDNSKVTLVSTSIFGCADKEDEGAGINICGENTELNLDTSCIQHCRADEGGGINIDGDSSNIFMAYSSIDNNYAESDGAGIYCNAEDVTIKDTAYIPIDQPVRSIISNNKAKGNAGGIYSNNSGLKVFDLDICNNTASIGGGAYVDSKYNAFNGCTFIANASIYGNRDNMSGSGGGAFIDSENNTFNECTFTYNTSKEAGSALYDNDDDNTLKNCTITNNTSETNKGAAYVCNTVDITLEGYMNISNNTGGDVYLANGIFSSAYILINPSKFDTSSSVGILMQNTKINMTCVQSTGDNIDKYIDCFISNSSSWIIDYNQNEKTELIINEPHKDILFDSFSNVGDFVNAVNNASNADVYINKNIVLSYPIEIKNYAKITIHLYGHVLSGDKIDVSSSFKRNTQIIKVGKAANLIIIGSENDEQAHQAHTLSGFNKNGEMKKDYNVYGGVINAGQEDDVLGIMISGDNSLVTLNNTTIFGCKDKEDEGAGIDICGENTKLCLNNSHIQHCFADCGGGINIDKDNSYIYMDHSSIDNNHSGDHGGGVHINGDNSYISMAYSSIEQNHADGNGAGIYCDAEGVTIEDTAYIKDDESTRSTISNNTAVNDGGGIYCNHDAIKVKKLKICNNNATVNGGGAYVNSENNTFDGCTFTGNTSTEAGSALYSNNDYNTLKNCTITDNCSESNEGAVYVCNTVDIILEGIIDITNNTGNDVCLSGNAFSNAYLIIDPFAFDISSRIGIFLKNNDDYNYERTCVVSTCLSYTFADIVSKYIECFFSNKAGYRFYKAFNECTFYLGKTC